MDVNDIIIRELSKEELNQRKPFSHFGWEGTGPFSFLTMSDGYWESAKIILATMKSKSNDFAIVDSLVYPLFFNYRHSIEVYLKMMYFNLGDKSDGMRKDFLNIGHDLYRLWATLRPFLNKGKKHVGCSVNLDAVEHYIKEINAYDPDSMVMRYPMEKDLTPNKQNEYHFDFIHFGDCMNELCDALRQIDYEFSNQMTESADYNELDSFLLLIDKYRKDIEEFLVILQDEQDKENKEFKVVSFDELLSNQAVKKSAIFLNECDSDLLILLDSLFYAGRTVKSNEVRLSKSPVERQRECVKLTNQLMEFNGLRLGVTPNEGQINIFGKTSSALFSCISTAMSIIDLLE